MNRFWWILLVFMCYPFSSIGLQNHFELNEDGFLRAAQEESWVDTQMLSLTLDQKIAQFFMLGVYPTQGEVNRKSVEKIIKDYNIGGILFFKGHPTQIAKWSNDFQNVAKTPLFVSIDGEWGVNMRVDSTIQYPRQLTLGAIQDDDLIFKMGQSVGRECKALGININFAPVIDVNNNINNPVINDRSFGEDKFNVALKGLAYAQGMQSVNVMAVGKHFPGHGDTDVDSHKDLPIINHSFERLDSLELFPFKVAIENGMMGMMVAHLNIPALDNAENIPSSLSKKVITDLLKDSLGFEGLAISDALNMKGVIKHFEPSEVDKMAFLAGTDVLLVPENIPKGIALIKKAVKDGEISEAYVDERLRKVLAYKYKLGLDQSQIVPTNNLNELLKSAEGKEINQQLFEKAITIASNEKVTLPLRIGQQSNTATLSIGRGAKQKFQSTIEGFGIQNHFYVANDITTEQATSQVAKLAKYDKVVISVHNMSRWKSKNYGFSAGELALIKKLNEKTEVVLVLFGTPYSLVHFDGLKSIMVAYEENDYSEIAAANALFGTIEVTGKLPVSAGKFKVNTGFDILEEKNVLQYAAPEDAGMDGSKLDSIDYFAKKLIKEEAAPGCQILVAKDGKIVYEKSFGYTTYTSNNEINNNTIYDLASITKVAATTLSIMKLYEEGKIDVNNNLKKYLPKLEGTSVGNLVIKEVMTHQSGLPAWIPFYKATIEDSVYNNYYQVDSNAAFCVKVADDLFICKDSISYIWKTIDGLTIKENQGYKYSDLGFYLLMEVIQNVSGKTLDAYVEETFYEPMGLKNIAFNPLRMFEVSRIPPTEKDTIFRKQDVIGYVHDPGAAMLGGVAGHAGLFSNAHDLAAIFQMLLDDGFYNGKQFFNAETIKYFNSTPYKSKDNRRAIGFDKPVFPNKTTGVRKGGPTAPNVSELCFGHTGFTGTCVWADPETNLVYVFLSNRTYPFATYNKLASGNYRTDIQALINRAVLK